jgi:nitroimidazol reductase NimA-like FMN-containing flavoprotein (pyridoxamine 5'-phosphate oxidase superfamily)
MILSEHPNKGHTDMRRRDRAVTDDAWIRRFLAEAPEGVLATSLDGQPFTHINTFVYDEATHAIYLHTAGKGRLRANIEANDRVSFCASRMGRLLPADTAREMSVEYDSVIAFGRASIVTDLALAREKMQMLLDKYFGHLRPGRDYRPITDAEIKEISVIRIAIDAWSAKRKEAEPDFPGAFDFGDRGDPDG